MSSGDFCKWFLPYCLEEVSQDRYVVLNRAYKPVGMVTDEWVEYAPHAVTIKMTPEMAQSLSDGGNTNTKKIYFYADGSVPTASADNMKKYLNLIAKLAACKVAA